MLRYDTCSLIGFFPYKKGIYKKKLDGWFHWMPQTPGAQPTDQRRNLLAVSKSKRSFTPQGVRLPARCPSQSIANHVQNPPLSAVVAMEIQVGSLPTRTDLGAIHRQRTRMYANSMTGRSPACYRSPV